MKVIKLLSLDLIRRFGNSVIETNDSTAKKYIDKGLAIEKDTDSKNKHHNVINKNIKKPLEDKAIWSPPEQKLFDENIKMSPYPGPDEFLFSQI